MIKGFIALLMFFLDTSDVRQKYYTFDARPVKDTFVQVKAPLIYL